MTPGTAVDSVTWTLQLALTTAMTLGLQTHPFLYLVGAAALLGLWMYVEAGVMHVWARIEAEPHSPSAVDTCLYVVQLTTFVTGSLRMLATELLGSLLLLPFRTPARWDKREAATMLLLVVFAYHQLFVRTSRVERRFHSKDPSIV